MPIDFGEPTRRKLGSSKEENEIREIFYQHWETMKNQTKAIISGIQTWRAESIRQIDLYAGEQLRMLEDDFKHQRAILDRNRDNNVEIAKSYRHQRENVQFKELCDGCRALNFQMAQLEFIQATNERPRVITVRQQNRGTRENQMNPHAYRSEEPQTRAMGRNGGDRSEVAFQASSYDTGDWSLVNAPSDNFSRSMSSGSSN